MTGISWRHGGAARRVSPAGGGELKWYAASNEARRGFCAVRLHVVLEAVGRDYISIAAGASTTPGPYGRLPYLRRRQGDYYQIEPGTPQSRDGSFRGIPAREDARMRRGLRHGRILRAAERPALPWKNGGGVTREVAATPPGVIWVHFDWRVSIAEIHSAGPFFALSGHRAAHGRA